MSPDPLPSETITARLGVAWRRHLKGEDTLPDFLREAMHLGDWAVQWLNAQMDDEDPLKEPLTVPMEYP